MPEPAPPPLPPPAVALPGYAEAILAELQRYPVCISTGVATAEAAQDLALGAFAAGEAVDGAVASIQAWGTVEGASARHDGASGGEILKRIGGFIRSGRNRRLRTPVEQRPGLQRPLDPEADLLALEVGKLWRSARHDLRREYGEVLEDGVEQRYAWLAGKAYAAARERSTTTAEPPVGLAFAAVKHWLRVYLRNDARFLVEAKHPLRLLRELEGLPWDASVRRERERPAPDGPGPDDVGPDLTEAILGLAKSGPLLPRRKTS